MASKDRKGNALFVTGVAPAVTGGGSRMRAAMTLEALVSRFNTYLLVIDKRDKPDWEALAGDALHRCSGVAFHAGAGPSDVSRMAVSPDAAELPLHTLQRLKSVGPPPDFSRAFPGVHFDLVHVMKSYIAPFVDTLLHLPRSDRPYLSLDLDDLESKTRSRIASLYETQGDADKARLEREQQTKYSRFERRLLPLFDRVYVCSDGDREDVEGLYGHREVRVLPNAISIPNSVRASEPAGPFTFLFLGSFGWYPNQDAARFFCREVLPQIRRRATSEFRVLIAGRSSRREVADLEAIPEVEVTGWLDDVADCYRGAHALIAPIRAAGGTRIKILESFSYRVPVVSTSLGAEGLAVEDRRHLLLADSAETFADRLLELMQKPALRLNLAERAAGWVAEHHTKANVERALEISPSDFSSARRVG